MRGFGLCKDALRVRVFKNSESTFDYQSPSTEEILNSGNDIRTGINKTLYKTGPNEVILIEDYETIPEGAQKLCTILNERSSSNPEGKWKIVPDSKIDFSGMAIPPNEVIPNSKYRKETLKTVISFGSVQNKALL